jgi:hypothetical protein
MRHNPDIHAEIEARLNQKAELYFANMKDDEIPDIPEVFIATTDIELVRNAGNQLERQLMKLHRYHHGPDCPTCQALLKWWDISGR